MLKNYKLTNPNKRVRAIENIIIETELMDSLNEGCQLTHDSSIAEYFLEFLITFDLKKATHSDKMDV